MYILCNRPRDLKTSRECKTKKKLSKNKKHHVLIIHTKTIIVTTTTITRIGYCTFKRVQQIIWNALFPIFFYKKMNDHKNNTIKERLFVTEMISFIIRSKQKLIIIIIKRYAIVKVRYEKTKTTKKNDH